MSRATNVLWSLGAGLAHAVRAGRTVLFAIGLVASLALLAGSLWLLTDARRQNASIRALAAGDDVRVDPAHDSGPLLVARGLYLLNRDRIDESQTLLDAAAPHVDPQFRARMLYNHANAHVRAAIAVIEKGELDKAIPLVRLAKDEYRQALRIDSAGWDIKHNYDVASRLVRDFPGVEREGEEVPPDAPKRLWTDLPGVPKGLP